MLRDMCALFLERKEFFLKLLWEHLEISMISILIAIDFGSVVYLPHTQMPSSSLGTEDITWPAGSTIIVIPYPGCMISRCFSVVHSISRICSV